MTKSQIFAAAHQEARYRLDFAASEIERRARSAEQHRFQIARIEAKLAAGQPLTQWDRLDCQTASLAACEAAIATHRAEIEAGYRAMFALCLRLTYTKERARRANEAAALRETEYLKSVMGDRFGKSRSVATREDQDDFRYERMAWFGTR